MQGLTLESDLYGRQILTPKVYLRAQRVEITEIMRHNVKFFVFSPDFTREELDIHLYPGIEELRQTTVSKQITFCHAK